MNKAALFISVLLALGSLDIVRGQAALSTYFCETSIPRDSLFTGVCLPCSRPVIFPVITVDRRLTPYTYTRCPQNGPGFISLDVGTNPGEERTFFAFVCGDNLFVALDPSKSTLAAEFFVACTDRAIIKCPPYQVFDQPTGRCVQRTTTLSSGLPCTKACGTAPAQVGLAAGVCENRLFSSLRPYCETCSTALVQQVITERNGANPAFHTFCPANGRFSLSITAGNAPKAFFDPYCNGINPLVPLDATRTSVAARYFWDCHSGLIACETGLVFNPATNRCTAFTGPLVDGLASCPTTCPAATNYSPYGSTYGGAAPYMPAAPMMPMMPMMGGK